ncbi:MAG TPA: Tol-Pal system beta propeller repeat protein TolB [Pelagibacterium sp.]|uniref:Tol-Pal system beta propeller repeat protein TolB n=1 Tax=Pelagibacterium sp. TaxID=1967288 RepID=UPI002C17DF03|nr:Tol-Pal system beta propeller repeat protein TolB [Pelagibacterium sp.]HWJ86932.1 Tol-Pal system beta propeller repeat protein TolB [Pelagibacterium sp.]
MTRRAALRLGLSGAALMAVSHPALAQLQITVSGGNFTPMPIAVPDFASGDASFGAEVAQVVRNNLTGSGLFRLVDPAGYPQRVGSPNQTPDFPSWRTTGADAVVMGEVNRAGQIQSSLRLWDTTAGAQVTGKSYGTDANSWRRIAHMASDAIYTGLTGETGYFDSRVVFVAESGPKANRVKRLAIMDQDGANVRYLTDGSLPAITPRLSPNGQMVAYMVLDGPNSSGIYILNLATGQTQSLGRFGQMSFAPRFSPDGRRLAFSVTQGAATNVYALDLAGGQPIGLTTGAAIDTSPSYSPDGQRLVFESDRGGRPQIYAMSAAGGGAERISFGNGSYSTPVWSPKGDLIAFTRQSGGQFSIGVMAPDGSGERILATSYHAEGPTWAPNGRVIMFFRDPGGNEGPQLYSIDVWGRNERRIATEGFASDPAWGPLLS